MKKILFVLLAVLVIAVSCTDRSVSDTASVRFGRLEAKSTVSGEVASASSLYWKYKATKVSGITYGQTSDYVALGSGAGLDYTINGFAPGEWKFQLRGYLDSGYTQLIYESAETTATLTAGNTSTVTFNVDIVEGSYGTLKTTNPSSVLGSTAFTVTCEGTHSDATTKLSSPNPAANTLKQGLWTLKYTFKDSATSAVLGTTEVTALIMNGATTTVTLTYEAQTGSFKASVNAPSNDSINWANAVKVGDIVTMGTYPATYTNSSGSSVSSGDYAGKGITWKVLEVDSTNKRALVISEKILCYREFSNTATNEVYKWSTSDLRTWLNGDFITSYGLSEVSTIETSNETEVATAVDEDETEKKADPITSSPMGTETSTEKVFLLSVPEITEYFAETSARIAYDLAGTAAQWWTRTSANFDYIKCVTTVTSNSIQHLRTPGWVSGVRPAFWISY